MIHDADRSDDELKYLPARMLNEFTYCPRLFFLEHVEGLFVHNADTVEGSARHRRVDVKTDALPSASEAASEADQRESIHARSVTLASDRYGIIAKLDLVEIDGLIATPVDYKRGAPKKLDDGSLGAWDPERVQICAQAMVLREHGYRCDEGVLFFWETRQRVRIVIDDELIRQAEQAIQQAQSLMDIGQIPSPLIDSPKCPRCSLVGICLPDETTRCVRIDSEDDSLSLIQPLLFDIGPQFSNRNQQEHGDGLKPIRQLMTARQERRPLYLNSQGYFVGKSGDVLQVKDKGKLVQEVRLRDVSQVNLMGSIQVSTQAVQGLLQAEIPLLYFTMGGWFYGMTQPVGLKNIVWRREQFRMADSPEFCLRVAKQWVSSKIQNQRTMLMRNHVEPPADALRFMKAMQSEADRSDSIPSLLGIEGMAARTYFEHFSGMLKLTSETRNPMAGVAEADDCDPVSESGPAIRFDFRGRNRRPPRDPVNALLSLGYSLLAKDLTVICASTGLDPYLGYYHQMRYGKPALALDLMEPFRPLIVDSAVLSAVNQRMVVPKHFVSAGDAVALTPEGRKGFFQAYEQRMDQLVTHPVFGYRVSYRRVLEIQTRLLARVLTGEIWHYPMFVTR